MKKKWWARGLQERYFERFLAQIDTTKEIISKYKREVYDRRIEGVEQRSVTLYIDVGDRGMPGGTKRDIEYNAQLMAEYKREIETEIERPYYEKPAEEKAQSAHAFFEAGDHDVESGDHGVSNLIREHELFGTQVLSQEFGPDEGGVLLLALETSFLDPEEEKNFVKYIDTEKGRKAWKIFRERKQVQINLLHDAADKARKGRKVVMIGHDPEVLLRLTRKANQEYDNDFLEGIVPNVTNIVAGHLHTEKVKKLSKIRVENNLGDDVQVSIPQTATVGYSGIQFEQIPTVVKLTIRAVMVEVENVEVKPEEIKEKMKRM